MVDRPRYQGSSRLEWGKRGGLFLGEGVGEEGQESIRIQGRSSGNGEEGITSVWAGWNNDGGGVIGPEKRKSSPTGRKEGANAVELVRRLL